MPGADYGDWGQTSAPVRKRLEEYCLRPLCGHIHWAHGTMWWAATNTATVSHTEGACGVRNCPCSKFAESVPISEDDVMDMALLLKPERVTLASLGIGDAESMQCRTTVMKTVADISIERRCGKGVGHAGDHAW